MQAIEGCPADGDRIAVFDADIGYEVAVAAFFHARAAIRRRRMGTKTIGRGARPLLERFGRRRMIGMGVGDEPVRLPRAYPPALACLIASTLASSYPRSNTRASLPLPRQPAPKLPAPTLPPRELPQLWPCLSCLITPFHCHCLPAVPTCPARRTLTSPLTLSPSCQHLKCLSSLFSVDILWIIRSGPVLTRAGPISSSSSIRPCVWSCLVLVSIPSPALAPSPWELSL